MTKTVTPKFLKRYTFLAFTLLMIAIVAVLITHIKQPHKTVGNYCRVYKEENSVLARANGDTYSVKVFSHSSSDPSDFVNAFSKLEAVAPKEIEPDVTTLKKTFQSIQDNPSSAISASLSGLNAEDSVTNWTIRHCNAK